MRTHTYICMCVCVYTCMYTYVYVFMCVYTHTHTHDAVVLHASIRDPLLVGPLHFSFLQDAVVFHAHIRDPLLVRHVLCGERSLLLLHTERRKRFPLPSRPRLGPTGAN